MNTHLHLSKCTLNPPATHPAFLCISSYQRCCLYGCLMLVGSLLFTRELHAQDTGTAGLMIEDSRLLGGGVLELSTTYADRVLHGSYGLIFVPPSGYSERSQALVAGVAYGLTGRIDIIGEIEWCADYCAGAPREYDAGFGDLRLGMKMQLWEGSEAWNLSWVPSFSLPSIGRRSADDEAAMLGMDQLIVVSGTAGKFATTVQSGVHYGYSSSPDPDLHLHLAGGFGYQLSGLIQPRLEVHFESAPGHGSGYNAATLMAGAVFTPTEQLRLDIGLHALALGEHAWRDRTLLVRLVLAP